MWPNLPVHICGSHGGTHTGTDGSSAQSIEDLAVYDHYLIWW